jgi:hypothetical protein
MTGLSIYPEDAKVNVTITSGYVQYNIVGGGSGGFPYALDEDPIAEMKKQCPKAYFLIDDQRGSYDKQAKLMQTGPGLIVYETGNGHTIEIDVAVLCQQIKNKQQNTPWDIQPLVDALCNSNHFVEMLTGNPYFRTKVLEQPGIMMTDCFIEQLIDRMQQYKEAKKQEAISLGQPPPVEQKDADPIEDRWDEIS